MPEDKLTMINKQIERDPMSGKFMAVTSKASLEKRHEVKAQILESVQDWAVSTGEQNEIKTTDNQIMRQLKILARTIEENTSGKTLMSSTKAAEYIAKLIGLFEDDAKEREKDAQITVRFDITNLYPDGLPSLAEPKYTTPVKPSWAKAEVVANDTRVNTTVGEYMPEGKP